MSMGEDRLVKFLDCATLGDVYGPDIDDAYEAVLKRCRADHHAGRLKFFVVNGFEVAVCSSCGTRFEETP